MARRQQLTLASALGNATSTPVDWQGGMGSLFVNGTFGGGAYQLQMQGPDGAWYSLGTTTTLSAQGLVGFTAPAGPMRLSGTGGAANSVNAWLVGIPTNNGG